jgi:hypothetical protein
MRIPSEIVTPYLSEIASQPRADDGTAEPVGQSARIGNALPHSRRNQQAEASQDRSPVDSTKAAPPNAAPVQPPPEQERRQEDRRKETRPVLLDTRLSKSRRKPAGYASINFEA